MEIKRKHNLHSTKCGTLMRMLGAIVVFDKTMSLQNDIYIGYFFKLLHERIFFPKGLVRKVGKCNKIE